MKYFKYNTLIRIVQSLIIVLVISLIVIIYDDFRIRELKNENKFLYNRNQDLCHITNGLANMINNHLNPIAEIYYNNTLPNIKNVTCLK
jgi:hypothetical protein